MLDLGTLRVGIKVYNEEAKKQLEDTKKITKETGEEAVASGGSFLKLGKTIKVFAIGAATALGALVMKITKDSVKAYASYEQNLGSIEKLYNGATDEMMKYADTAWQRLQMSKDEYFALSETFAARLLRETNNNTGEAARLNDMMMTDIMDNHNSLNTDVSSLQSAYEGFAKGNFRMLGNLNLGYASSKEGMEQLLADAEELTGVHYDINSMEDMITAIHVVQEDIGITGTSAEEAASTIQGSVAATKAAYQNFLVGLADPDADIGELADNLIESIGNVVNNLLPVLERILPNIFIGLGKLTIKLAPIIFDAFIDALRVGADALDGWLNNLFETKIIKPLKAKGQSIKDAISNWWSGVKLFFRMKLLEWKMQWILTFVGIKQKFKDSIANMKQDFHNFFQGLKKLVTGIGLWFVSPFIQAFNKIKQQIAKLKAFINKWKPKINLKVPHIKVKGGKAPWGIGGKGEKPQFSVKWYKDGAIFNKPTLFDTPYGLKGVGEAGAEAVIPIDKLWEKLDTMAAAFALGNSGGSDVKNINITLEVDGKKIATTTAPYLQTELDKITSRTNRKMGVNNVY